LQLALSNYVLCDLRLFTPFKGHRLPIALAQLCTATRSAESTTAFVVKALPCAAVLHELRRGNLRGRQPYRPIVRSAPDPKCHVCHEVAVTGRTSRSSERSTHTLKANDSPATRSRPSGAIGSAASWLRLGAKLTMCHMFVVRMYIFHAASCEWTATCISLLFCSLSTFSKHWTYNPSLHCSLFVRLLHCIFLCLNAQRSPICYKAMRNSGMGTYPLQVSNLTARRHLLANEQRCQIKSPLSLRYPPVIRPSRASYTR
jgi:hypothetical protein